MRTTIDMPEDLHRIAASIARDKSQTLSQVVVELMARALDKEPPAEIEVDDLTGFPLIHVKGVVTTEEVRALEDNE